MVIYEIQVLGPGSYVIDDDLCCICGHFLGRVPASYVLHLGGMFLADMSALGGLLCCIAWNMRASYWLYGKRFGFMENLLTQGRYTKISAFKI